jgi:hypothetical protein
VLTEKFIFIGKGKTIRGGKNEQEIRFDTEDRVRKHYRRVVFLVNVIF